MQTMNSINLLGHVGQDVELFQFPDGGRKATVKIATNTGSGDNKKTHWHTLIFYNNAADIVSLLKSGDAICVEGTLEYRQWVDQYQQTRSSPEIIVGRFSIVKGEIGQIQGANQTQYNGGHQQSHSQGSYQNIKGNGGYDNRNKGNGNSQQNNQNQGGYNNRPQGNQNQGGYNNRPQGNQNQGGYNNRPQGNQNQGGYNNRNAPTDMA